MNLAIWIGAGVGAALLVLWLVSRAGRKGSEEVMERLAGSSERPAAFGRPSASVWDKESKSNEIAPPKEDDPPDGRRPKGTKTP